ncbi:MAG: 3-dehydroquinate synthase [Clostridia bacterium]|nr:3-dehydroquinate synthase [Clostridia bacterium]
MKKTITTERGHYDIHIARGLLARAGELFDLDRRVLILTDDGVPAVYAQKVAACCKKPTVLTIPQGEGSKSLSSFELILRRMLEEGFTRTDAVVAVGGGVCGDLGGFVASAYMRGVNFYNIPTTLLSQVDSSVGGKTAVDLAGIKNCVGAFYPPMGVLIDPDVLKTLAPRQVAAGMAEVIKMAATSDTALFSDLEKGLFETNIEETISRALSIKATVVEADEREGGLRRILNFGHTIGHGIESCTDLLHGECVALGMLPMCGEEVRARLLALFSRYGLPTEMQGDPARVVSAIFHDKKLAGGTLRTVYVPTVGSFEIRSEAVEDFAARVKEVLSQ